MSTREFDPLAREELRALFVLGIIGTLLGVRDVLDINLGYGITFSFVATLLMIYWGIYVFLMAIGISDDLVRLRVANTCATAAAVCFILGICSMIGMVLFTVVSLVLVQFIDQSMTLIVASIVAVVSTIIAVTKIIARDDKSA